MPVYLGKNGVEVDDYRKFNFTRTSDHNYYLTAKDKTSGIDYAFTVNGDDRITFTHLLQPNGSHSLQWGYNNFALLNEISFPHKMNISLSSNSKKVDAELLFQMWSPICPLNSRKVCRMVIPELQSVRS